MPVVRECGQPVGPSKKRQFVPGSVVVLIRLNRSAGWMHWQEIFIISSVQLVELVASAMKGSRGSEKVLREPVEACRSVPLNIGAHFPPTSGHEHGKRAILKPARRPWAKSYAHFSERGRLTFGSAHDRGREWRLLWVHFPKPAVLHDPGTAIGATSSEIGVEAHYGIRLLP